MDLDPMISSAQEDYSYFDYDNRPIRPMNQEALNETLARLPILIDIDDDASGNSDSSASIKARLTNRRQPVLAYSTRRKNPQISNNSNQSLLHINTTIGTPKSNKRKLGGCTPTVTPSANKVIKQLDCQQELTQLKEENRLLAEAKENLQVECALLKNAHEVALENLKQEHERIIDELVQECKLQREQYDAAIVDKEQLIVQAHLELDNLRNDCTLLLLEKEVLQKTAAEYELFKEEVSKKLSENEETIRGLREEIEKLVTVHEQKKQEKKLLNKSTSTGNRTPLTVTSNRLKTTGSAVPTNAKSEPTQAKINNKVSATRGTTRKAEISTTPNSSVNTTLNKLNSSTSSSAPTLKVAPPSKSKSKPSVIIEEKKASVPSVQSTDKRISLIATRTRSKVTSVKS